MNRKKKLTLKDMPTGDDEGKYTKEFRKSLLRSALEVRQGKVCSLKKVVETYSPRV